MHEKKSRRTQANSFSSFHDLFGFWRPLYYVSKNKGEIYKLTIGPNCKQCDNETPHIKRGLITVEQIQALNSGPCNFNPVGRSTSTIFYDLDILAKRHSCHCLIEDKKSDTSYLKSLCFLTDHTHSDKHERHGNTKTYTANDEIQQTKVAPQDSIQSNPNKINKLHSSEVILKDIHMDGYHSTDIEAYKLAHTQYHQFWSHPKSENQPDESTIDENQVSIKGSSINEDPCLCELFSYPCPCQKTSAIDLGRNKINRTTVNQVTSTLRLQYSTSKDLPDFREVIENDGDDLFEVDQNSKYTQVNKRKRSPYRKLQKNVHRLTCPKCYHKIEILSSTDSEDAKKNNPIPSANISAANASIYTKYIHEEMFGNKFRAFCPHDPMCATIPLCQATTKHSSKSKSHHHRPSPRVIRITKACRHYPPCTVVPSCQKINVLKNNCEYIPPCFHRPRCVNIPLCVPCSKSVNYDQNLNAELEDHFESLHVPPCRHLNRAQYTRSNIDPPYRDVKEPHYRDVQVVSHVQNSPVDVLSPTNATKHSSPSTQKSMSPCATPQTCRQSRPTKSCQYEPDEFISKEPESESDVIIYIRDVGCQIKKRNYYLTTNYLSKNTKREINSYFANVHTLRYENKSTNVVRSSSEEVQSKACKIAKSTAECDSAQLIAAFTHIDPVQAPFTSPSKNTDATPKPSMWALSIARKASSLKCKIQSVSGIKKRKKYRLNTNNVITIYSRKSSHCKI